MANESEGGTPTIGRIDAARGAVTVAVDASIYPLDAVFGAAYTFIDRCYVLVEREGAERFLVTLARKDGGAEEAALRALAGELGNELLSCAFRHRITRDNQALVELVTAQALGGALGPPSLDDLANYDFTDEPLEDPLGIAVSWEEKYKKKAPPVGEGSGEGSGQP